MKEYKNRWTKKLVNKPTVKGYELDSFNYLSDYLDNYDLLTEEAKKEVDKLYSKQVKENKK